MADRRMAKDTSINKGLLLSIGVAFLVQAGGFVWWMSGLNSEVTRLASIQETSIPALTEEARKIGIAILKNAQAINAMQENEEAVRSLDVLAFKVDQLREEIKTLREVDREIMQQHEKIFDWMASNGRSAGGGNPYSTDGY